MDPPTDSPPQSSHNLFENLQWSELCFTEEDIEEWSLVPFNTDGNEEVKDTSYEVNNSLKKSEEAAVLESNNIVATETFHTVSPIPDVPVQLGIDVSSHFSTNQVFNSREALIQWCQDAGKQLNMVIIILKSEKPSWKSRGRLLLCCERGGPQDYRKRIKKKDKHEVKPRKPAKAKKMCMGTKKCDCPFKLKGVPLEEGKWKLQVSCGIHNHELTETLVGRPGTSQLISKEKNTLLDVTANGVSPIEVLPIIECQNAGNCSIMKTTYNAKTIVSLGDIDERNATPVPDSQASLQASGRDQLIEVPAPYKHIERNEFSYRKHKKQKAEDIVICECRHDANDPDSACGEQCLNVLTSTECTPGYCPCGNYCQNQKFQKCEYAMTKLFISEGRGWGLLAEENIKTGQFVIEYCGEVISCKEAKRRSHTYEAAGLKDAYIIYLNANESIDATRKGSLARFINHSCQPNCETRKWTVLGEVRVGIFAKQDIPIGTELAYDYNFEWYGGAKVRCRCGASSCSEFLGAKSRGFQEATYLWEDDDDRYSIEKVPLYDSEDDEPISKLLKTTASPDNVPMDESEDNELGLSVSMPIVADPLDSIQMEMDEVNNAQTENSNYTQDTPQDFTKKSALIPRIQSSSCRIYHIESSPLSKRSRDYSNGRSKNQARKQVNVEQIVDRLVSKEAREEILASQERKNLSAAKLDMLYDEIRPAIEEHERDSQDSVSTAVAEKWIVAHCENMRSEFDFFSSIIKNIACASQSAQDGMSSEGADTGIDIKTPENNQ